VDKKVFTIGDGKESEFILTHNLGTADIVVSVRENKLPGTVVGAEVEIIDTDTIKISFGIRPEGTFSVTAIG